LKGAFTVTDHPGAPRTAWLVTALAGGLAPVCAILLSEAAPVGPLMAIGMMGAGMIGAAAAGRLTTGVVLALLAGIALAALAKGLGIAGWPHPAALSFALLIAAISFAARGALFARSAQDKGWWIALAVVGGEGAMLFVAWAQPGALPDWLLALLPAQWASAAIRTALSGTGAALAGSELAALAGTAAATLLVAKLWPRRWPYLIMFTAWLGLSALVLHRPSLAEANQAEAQALPAAAR